MCQLNVYCVDKNISEESIKKCFAKEDQNLFYKLDCIKIKRHNNRYNYYCCASMGCNCGTLLCSTQNCNDKTLSYKEYIYKIHTQELNDLIKIKELLENPNYRTILNNYEKNYETIIKEKEEYYKDFQTKFFDKEHAILNNTQISNADRESKLNQLNLEKIEQYNTISKKPEVIKIFAKIKKFFDKNKIIIQSRFYNLIDKFKTEDPCIHQSVYYKLEQFKNCEDINTKYCEYEDYLNIIKNMLKLTDKIKIFAFWQNEDYFDDTLEKQSLKVKDLKIEDIAFLKYKEILTITK